MEKMVITKELLLAMRQRCLDKLPDDATDRERYLAGEYEFENRLRDAIHSHEKMPLRFSGFSDAVMDVIQDAADRLTELLADARDEHDRQTAYRLFEERAFNAIKAEMLSEAAAQPVKDTAPVEVVRNRRPPPAPPPPAPAPAPASAPVMVVEDRPRVQIEVIDRQEVPDVIPNDAAEELERALAKPMPTADMSEPVSTPYTKYEQALTDGWKQPPPSPPKKRKKGVPHDLV